MAIGIIAIPLAEIGKRDYSGRFFAIQINRIGGRQCRRLSFDDVNGEG
jgi:hypothetical protein